MPYCDDKKVIFLHIPKTGGTAIKRLLNIRNLDDPNPAIRPSLQHLTCTLLRQKMGNDKYDQFYKFTFIRNPWARMVSEYFWRKGMQNRQSLGTFGEFVAHAHKLVSEKCYYEHKFGDHFIPQTDYTLDVDDVFRFEQYGHGVQAVAEKLGLNPVVISSKKAKPSDKYWEFYDNKSRATIHDLYRTEIEEFDYSFGRI